ncbi:MAG: hypothetical protein GWM98_19290 [Nitrospinaceae bacterium]|nr:hypothetical protein [Nitrospinaceae bacterium]NIR56234.1 hypothetical protein [Nitrospinaceae bacterium]NIS86690.1 hypothetical protein [Nitrospinaceae bacterium]NIT83523.1 hypothetical protein [Nitrospinaceae bacterium]NIU45728.1 hypothetical protein [Nitrospinaceae bacterium]
MRLNRTFGPILVFGEVLHDVYPDRRQLGGAPYNYAYHLSQMGFPVRLISRVGGDEAGKDILEYLQKIGFSIEGVQMDIIHKTGEVIVDLNEDGEAEFNIQPDRAYDYIEYDPYIDSLAREENPIIHFGTLIQRHTESANTLKKILQVMAPKSTVMVDINLRYPFYNEDVIRTSLEYCDILKINAEELEVLQDLLKIPPSYHEPVRYLLDAFKIGFACVTKGAYGSALYEAGNPVSFHCSVFPPEKIVDTVGTGDAYSAMLTAGYLASLPKQSLIEKASEFASRICGIPGALPENADFYNPYRFD